ncbi:MAG TPA: hypothetical protein PLY70_03645 [Saprospiraceae bacterium]|nr:hypothetical protein [Saprospiraceae bacterium]HPN69084.1 hypothetical protein [Saprospiraceae bacterium]
MKSIQKQVFFTFLFIFSSFIAVFAGETAPTLMHSPANPVAGQTVTFTVSETNVSSCEIVKVAPDLENNPSLLLDLTLTAGFYTTTYVYPSPGTYQIGYDVEPNPACISINRKTKKTNRALEFFSFGPVGGPFAPATDNGNFISAPLVIGAPAPIPTMGEWGIIILGLLSTIFGVVMMNQKYFRLSRIKS